MRYWDIVWKTTHVACAPVRPYHISLTVLSFDRGAKWTAAKSRSTVRRYGWLFGKTIVRMRLVQILSHALARLHVTNERRFEWHLQSPGECWVATIALFHWEP